MEQICNQLEIDLELNPFDSDDNYKQIFMKSDPEFFIELEKDAELPEKNDYFENVINLENDNLDPELVYFHKQLHESLLRTKTIESCNMEELLNKEGNSDKNQYVNRSGKGLNKNLSNCANELMPKEAMITNLSIHQECVYLVESQQKSLESPKVIKCTESSFSIWSDKKNINESKLCVNSFEPSSDASLQKQIISDYLELAEMQKRIDLDQPLDKKVGRPRSHKCK